MFPLVAVLWVPERCRRLIHLLPLRQRLDPLRPDQASVGLFAARMVPWCPPATMPVTAFVSLTRRFHVPCAPRLGGSREGRRPGAIGCRRRGHRSQDAPCRGDTRETTAAGSGMSPASVVAGGRNVHREAF